MKKLSLFLCTVLALFLLGCAGSSVPNRYYTLAGSEPQKASKSLPYRLAIQKFSADPAYGKPNIVYRESPYEFMSYGNDFWASSPEHQIENLLAESFEKSGTFARVERRASEMPDLELSGLVLAIEEIDSSESLARVSLTLTLRNARTGRTIWTKTFDETERISERKPVEVAKAASVLVSRYAETALGEISEILAQNPVEKAETANP